MTNRGNQALTITSVTFPRPLTAPPTTPHRRQGDLNRPRLATITVTPLQVPQTLPQVMLGSMPVAFNTS